MRQEDYEKQVNRAFARLEGLRPSMRVIVPGRWMRRLDLLATALYYSGAFLAGAGLVWLHVRGFGGSVIGALPFMFLVGGISAFCAALFSMLLSYRYTFERRFLRRLMGLAGLSALVDAEQARDITAWSSHYPKIRDASIQWAAKNPSHLLGEMEYLHIERVVARVEYYARERKITQREEASRAEVEQVFQESGMMGAAKAQSESSALQKSTAEATGSQTQARRI